MSGIETHVPIGFDDVYWAIHATELDLPKENDPIIQLEWGWAAGMSDEDMKDIAADAPTGKETVKTTLRMAIRLRDQLNVIIAKHSEEETLESVLTRISELSNDCGGGCGQGCCGCIGKAIWIAEKAVDRLKKERGE